MFADKKIDELDFLCISQEYFIWLKMMNELN